MPNILFSIIIPTYNRADLIEKTIESLLKQSYNNFEIIVVDDGSTDNTEEIVRKIKDTRIRYYRKENAERAAARNYGAKVAKGDYVNFFDSDDLAYTNHLQEALSIIEKHNNPEVFHLFYDIKDVNGRLLRSPSNISDINKQLIKGNILSCNGVFVRIDIALNNLFNEDIDLSASEDYLLWLKLASKHSIIHKNVVTSTIIEHDNRSVLNIHEKKLIKRKELMLHYLFSDRKTADFYKQHKLTFYAGAYSYISLHLVMANHRKKSLEYFIKAIIEKPTFILSKRALAIIKRLIF